MTIYFDESMGTGVPQALRLVGFEDLRYARSYFAKELRQVRRIEDRRWIPEIGERGWLAITQDRAILDDLEERHLLSAHGVGIVFLASGEELRHRVLAFMLRRMDWLQEIDKQERPFAYVTSLRGKPRRIDL